MTDKQKNFITRTLTSIVFVVVLVGCILWHPLAYAVLFGAITAMTAWEFCTIVNRHADLQVNKLITTISCVYLFLAVMGYNLNMAGSEAFIPYLVSIIYLMVSELYFDNKNSIYNWAFAMMCQMYVAIPFASRMFNLLRLKQPVNRSVSDLSIANFACCSSPTFRTAIFSP